MAGEPVFVPGGGAEAVGDAGEAVDACRSRAVAGTKAASAALEAFADMAIAAARPFPASRANKPTARSD
ncbi:MAG: hypothetical protein ABSC06_19630 [Rhodopila sp.]